MWINGQPAWPSARGEGKSGLGGAPDRSGAPIPPPARRPSSSGSTSQPGIRSYRPGDNSASVSRGVGSSTARGRHRTPVRPHGPPPQGEAGTATAARPQLHDDLLPAFPHSRVPTSTASCVRSRSLRTCRSSCRTLTSPTASGVSSVWGSGPRLGEAGCPRPSVGRYQPRACRQNGRVCNAVASSNRAGPSCCCSPGRTLFLSLVERVRRRAGFSRLPPRLPPIRSGMDRPWAGWVGRCGA